MILSPLLAVLFASGTQPEPDTMPARQVAYLTPQALRQFAEYLEQQGEHLRAAGELERLLVLQQSRPAENPVISRDSLLLLIGRSYRRANVPEPAISYLQRAARTAGSAELGESANYEVAAGYFGFARHRQALDYLEAHPAATPAGTERSRFLSAASLASLGQWRRAAGLVPIPEQVGSTRRDTLVATFGRILDEGVRKPRRSRVAAGLMSAVIPGLGKVYAGRWPDGLFALTEVALTGWQAYVSFKTEGVRSVKGWIYGSLGAAFYLGDIWGSLVAARQHNDKLENKLRQRLLPVFEALEREP